MVRCTLLLFLFLLFALRANAQFNDSVHYRLGYSGTGILNRTNDGQSYVFNNGLRFNIKKEDIEFNSSNTWIYGQQKQQLTNNDYNSTLDFNLYKTFPHFYYWGLATYETSYSLKINSRGQAGLGIAYNIFDRKDTLLLNVSNGIIYEESNLRLSDSTNNVYSTFRNSFRLRFRWHYKKLVTFDGVGFIQNSLSDGNDYNLKGNASLSFKLWKWVSLTSAVTYNRINLTGRENLLMTFGIGIERYF